MIDHVVTVGDLCFVALGQIVNRSSAAVRHQPTGGLVISLRRRRRCCATRFAPSGAG
jgi:hypothetical protein